FLAICYHAVEDKEPDQRYNAVSTAKLVQQFSWLARNGYHPVSVDQLLAARDGKAALPEKPVLLTFDDGYESFYTRAYPVLKAFNYPAVIGLVHSWMSGPPQGEVEYGDSKTKAPRALFMSWDQVREVMRSGLVEVAAHSDNLHRGILANPQGNLEPAAVTRQYDPTSGSYESAAAYEARLKADAAGISAEIARETGKRPRVMIWPYGEHNKLAISIFAAAGMPITTSLATGVGAVRNLADTPRQLVADDPELAEYVADVHRFEPHDPMRVVQIDLDYVYDPDPAQQEKNLGLLVDRVYALGVSAVFLQAFADPEGSGLVKAVYFPNKLLPMRADLFNRVAWQLRTRTHVEVYGWLPVLSFDFGADATRVLSWSTARGSAAADAAQPARLSPFDLKARELILELYEEMAEAAPIAGLLFSDDALLTDFEDASPPALAAYGAAGFAASIDAIRADAKAMAAWTAFKTGTLIDFTKEIAERVRLHRGPIKTARNLFARPLLEPESRAWFAQDLDSFLAAYDYTAVMAMPLMEGAPAEDADAWLERLLTAVAAREGGLARTVFELQAVDWRVQGDGPGRQIPTAILAHEMRLLARRGAVNFGYYPDDAAKNHPDVDELRKALSLETYPYRP
ncbi:MAG: poly-beta-1,6-N-acetyl-D-glucosamine N-deacetylase PgaB, partial [Alphaproteobacteria bacterium]